jgi:tetratricopeptide (TPR) repeat protein
MRHTAKGSFFIRDLAGCDPRQAHPGAIIVVPQISAAALLEVAASSSHRRLAESIRLGETAQGLRSAEGLSRASQSILSLPLGKVADSIGRYYRALSLNRQGPDALPEAGKILTDVADHGPLLFRAKACVALGTVLRRTGDDKAALETYGEAARIAGECESGGLLTLFMAALQCAVIRFEEGDCRRALADIQDLEPLAHRIALECPPLLHSYYNNLAAVLLANGRTKETRSYSNILTNSPFLARFPEWQRTCADIAVRTRPPSRSLVLIGEPLTDEPEALTAPVTLVGEEHAVGFQRLPELLKDGPSALPESSSKSFGEAERLQLASAVDAQPRLAESVTMHPAAPSATVGSPPHLAESVVTHSGGLGSTVDFQPQLAESPITHPAGPATAVDAQPHSAESSVTHPVAPARAAAVSPSTAAVSLSVPAAQTAACWAARTLGVPPAFRPLKASQLSRRISINLFSGRLLSRQSIAARDRAPSPRISKARLLPLRWSYLRCHPAYPRPPNSYYHC